MTPHAAPTPLDSTSQTAGTLERLQILAQSHPEIMNDPSIVAAMHDPGALQVALQGWQHAHGMDPNGLYDNAGTLQNSSWFSDNLPWITAAMGGALVAPAAIAALGGGAAAGGGGAAATTAAAAPAATTAAGASLFGIPAGSLVTAGTQLFGNLFGANLQANASKDAAALQAQEAAAALAFEKASAENSYQNSEAARAGNYGVWSAEQNRLGSLGEELGMGPRNIPAYVPGVDPNFTGAGTPPPTPGSPTSAAPTTSTSGAPSKSSANYQQVISLINSGMSPQQAIDQANSAQGLASGSSFAWRSIPGAPGGGVVEIPGGAYLTPNPQGQWGFAPGDTAGGGSSASSTGMFTPYVAPTVPFLNRTPVAGIPGTIGGY